MLHYRCQKCSLECAAYYPTDIVPSKLKSRCCRQDVTPIERRAFAVRGH